MEFIDTLSVFLIPYIDSVILDRWLRLESPLITKVKPS